MEEVNNNVIGRKSVVSKFELEPFYADIKEIRDMCEKSFEFVDATEKRLKKLAFWFYFSITFNFVLMIISWLKK
jgi:hypothetical protein